MQKRQSLTSEDRQRNELTGLITSLAWHSRLVETSAKRRVRSHVAGVPLCGSPPSCLVRSSKIAQHTSHRSKKQGAYGRVPTIKAGTLSQLSHVDEVKGGVFCGRDIAIRPAYFGMEFRRSCREASGDYLTDDLSRKVDKTN